MEVNQVTDQVIGAAIAVHRALGPGLLESAYEACLGREMGLQGIPFERQFPLPLVYEGEKVDCGYRVDFVVSALVAVEIKAVEGVLPVHCAQLLSYLRLGNWPVGLLINFHVTRLRDGIRRLVNGYRGPPVSPRPPRLRGETLGRTVV